MRLGFFVFALLGGIAGCGKTCPPGQVARGDRCVSAVLAERAKHPELVPKPPEMSKRPPLAAPELIALPTLAPFVLGGKAPRWNASVEEVRKLGGAKGPLVLGKAWQLGLVHTLHTMPEIKGVRSQLDYFFLGDNLVGYGVSFFVDAPPSQALYDAIIAEAGKAYGEPQTKAAGNTDWRKGHLSVHAALTESPAMTKQIGRKAELASIHFTIPPSEK